MIAETIETKERPILFSALMVKAILDGRKTQTRKVIKNPERLMGLMHEDEAGDWCPYGKPGDLLVPRTTWAVLPEFDHLKPSELDPDEISIWFWHAGLEHEPTGRGKKRPGRFLPKILWCYMPRLEITKVEVERVQEITVGDVGREGIPQPLSDQEVMLATLVGDDQVEANRYIESFFALWNSINEKRGYGWEKNPWVWVITFKRIEIML